MGTVLAIAVSATTQIAARARIGANVALTFMLEPPGNQPPPEELWNGMDDSRRRGSREAVGDGLTATSTRTVIIEAAPSIVPDTSPATTDQSSGLRLDHRNLKLSIGRCFQNAVHPARTTPFRRAPEGVYSIANSHVRVRREAIRMRRCNSIHGRIEMKDVDRRSALTLGLAATSAVVMADSSVAHLCTE
jgi:hypothetical protein